jgi:hypothetical protein
MPVNHDDVIHVVITVGVDPTITPAPIARLDEVAEGPGVVEYSIPRAMTPALGAQGLPRKEDVS